MLFESAINRDISDEEVGALYVAGMQSWAMLGEMRRKKERMEKRKEVEYIIEKF